MRLSSKGRYTIMALLELVPSSARVRPLILADLAKRQDISLSYLEQIFARLRRAGIVKSVRGPGGGYLLAKPAADIFISDILATVEDPPESQSSAAQNTVALLNSSKAFQATENLWLMLGVQIKQYLARVTLADVHQQQLPV